MSNDGDWLFQLSMKRSPDAPMINIRAYTAQDLAVQMQELAEFADVIGSRVEQVQAVAALAGSFPGTSRVQDTPPAQTRSNTYDQTRGNSRNNGGNRGGTDSGQTCGPHGLPLESRSGTKNGKSWSGLFCTAKSNPCSPIWDD